MSPERKIPTNFRTLLILEVLGKSDRPMSATEINEKMELPKQTIHRLVLRWSKKVFFCELVMERSSDRRDAPD